MSRMRMLLLLLFSVLAVSAVASASASAFVVEECGKVEAGKGKYEDSHCKTLGGAKEFEWKPVANETLFLDSGGLATLKSKIAGQAIDIDCTKSTSHGFVWPTGLNLDTITYENCQLYTLSGGVATLICEIPNITALLHSELVGTLAAPEEKFTPETGTVFAVISLPSPPCPSTFPRKVEVKGEITCQLPGATSASLAHEVSCTESDKGLTLGKEEAFYIGKAEVWLQNDHLWRTS